MTDERILLEARNIRKRFPGTLALDGVDFRVFAGKVHAVAGENGAGKSTLMNIISGTCTDFEGSLTVNARGVAMIHQELNLVPWMSVAENIFLGREPRTRAGLVDTKRMEREAGSILEGLGSTIDSRSPVHSLRVGEQQIVEIAKALSMQAEVLIMDEPTSSLSEKETEVLFGVVRDLASKGTGIVYITHKMAEISALADHVTILRDGRLIKEVPLKETSIDEIIRCMVGRDSAGFTHGGDRTPGETVLQVEGLSLQDPAGSGRARLSGIGFEVRAGEILGIYGLMGAGRRSCWKPFSAATPAKSPERYCSGAGLWTILPPTVPSGRDWRCCRRTANSPAWCSGWTYGRTSPSRPCAPSPATALSRKAGKRTRPGSTGNAWG